LSTFGDVRSVLSDNPPGRDQATIEHFFQRLGGLILHLLSEDRQKLEAAMARTGVKPDR